MKVKNTNGNIVNVPDDWSEETLRERSLVRVVQKLSNGKKAGQRPLVSTNYAGMTLDQLKTLARKRKLQVGRSTKKRIVQILEQSE